MDDRVAHLAEAAKRASSNIVRLVATATANADESIKRATFEEVQETLLALIAALIAADRVTTNHEFVFASLVAKDLRDPLRCRAYLNEYADRWRAIAEKTPRFLTAVVDYDASNKTALSRNLIGELRNVINSVAHVDGECADAEAKAAEGLIARADALFRQARWTVSWGESPYPTVVPSTAMNRDEFRNREII